MSSPKLALAALTSVIWGEMIKRRHQRITYSKQPFLVSKYRETFQKDNTEIFIFTTCTPSLLSAVYNNWLIKIEVLRMWKNWTRWLKQTFPVARKELFAASTSAGRNTSLNTSLLTGSYAGQCSHIFFSNTADSNWFVCCTNKCKFQLQHWPPAQNGSSPATSSSVFLSLL